MPFSLLQTAAGEAFLSLFGQAVKVKNTFIDDVLEEADESTGDRAAQTCPAGFSPGPAAPKETIPSVGMLTTDWGETLYEWPQGYPADHGNTAVDLGQPTIPPPPPSMPPQLAGRFQQPQSRFYELPPSSLPRVPPFPPPSTPPLRTWAVAKEDDSQSTAASDGIDPRISHEDSPTDLAENFSSGKLAEVATGKRRSRGGRRSQQLKVWCHFFLDDVMLWNGFDLNKKLIGHGGGNTKKIFEATDAKIRLRGRGSGHSEAGRGEAPVHLMLAVTTDIGEEEKFVLALEMAAELLQQVTGKYRAFCKQNGMPSPTSPLFWIGELSEQASACLGTDSPMATLGRVPVTVKLEDSKPRGRKGC
mmetsp:Transcript_23527/g.42427  ORF Transcript_23527/g.42427 Transcript_23527/m.42427 type:complete len:360 (+) Transcript_23527:69-1148(+)